MTAVDSYCAVICRTT